GHGDALLAKQLAELETVNARHDDVEDDQIRRRRQSFVEALNAVGGFDGLVAFAAQEVYDGRTNRLIVVNDENPLLVKVRHRLGSFRRATTAKSLRIQISRIGMTT